METTAAGPTMYYVVSVTYIGDHRDSESDTSMDDMVNIQTLPGRTNISGSERIDGWLGSTHGWDCWAWGEYETLEEAQAFIQDKWGKAAIEIDPTEDIVSIPCDGSEPADVVVATYQIHDIDDGEIVTVDLDDDDGIWEQLHTLPEGAEIAYSLDQHGVTITDAVARLLGMDPEEILSELDESVIAEALGLTTESGYLLASAVETRLGTHYERVQLIDAGSDIAILVAEPITSEVSL